MPLLVGGIAALVAIAAGIIGQVDPLASLGRALLAFVLGWFGANLWYVLFTALGPTRQPRRESEAMGVTESEQK